MASATTTDIYDCTPEQFYKIISDYEKYHEFLAEVKKCRVVKSEGDKKLVEYSVQVVKSFKYNLWMTEKENQSIHWKLESGDIFKTSTGSWVLSEAAGGKTKAVYTVEATFSMFVPGPIAKALVSVNLPAMVASYRKRISQVYGK